MACKHLGCTVLFPVLIAAAPLLGGGCSGETEDDRDASETQDSGGDRDQAEETPTDAQAETDMAGTPAYEAIEDLAGVINLFVDNEFWVGPYKTEVVAGFASQPVDLLAGPPIDSCSLWEDDPQAQSGILSPGLTYDRNCGQSIALSSGDHTIPLEIDDESDDPLSYSGFSTQAAYLGQSYDLSASNSQPPLEIPAVLTVPSARLALSSPSMGFEAAHGAALSITWPAGDGDLVRILYTADGPDGRRGVECLVADDGTFEISTDAASLLPETMDDPILVATRIRLTTSQTAIGAVTGIVQSSAMVY
ncbi:MAG: hypothetical protein JW797_00065 [Bradymonadales bacterium]|nr:hypothetical protein [Bradymonadales bacterium]